jgi:hypothetical protein
MELLDSDTKFGFIIMDGSGTVRPFSRYTYTSCSYQSNFPSFPTTALRNPLWKHPSDPAQVLGRSPQEARFVLSLATAGFRHGLRLLTIQPALRFVRSRRSIRPSFLRKVAEHSVQHFITDDKVNVQGIVLAGSADFKSELNLSDLFDPRLVAKVVNIVDVSYGGKLSSSPLS